jgi:hypothetical protein
MSKFLTSILFFIFSFSNSYGNNIDTKVLSSLLKEARTCTVYYKILDLYIQRMPQFSGKETSLKKVSKLLTSAEQSYEELFKGSMLPKDEFQKSIEKEFVKLIRISGNAYQHADRFKQIYEENCLKHISNPEQRYHYWKSKFLTKANEESYNWKLKKVYYCDIIVPDGAPPPPNPIITYSFVTSFNEENEKDKYAIQLYFASQNKEQQAYDTYRNDEILYYGIANDIVEGTGKILVIDKLKNKAENTIIFSKDRSRTINYSCTFSD